MHISVVAPVYNEQQKIGFFLQEVDRVLNKINEQYEIMLVDDHSTDDTYTVLTKLKSTYPKLKVIRLNQNSGQHIATSIALKEAKGEYVFMLDSDLQIAPEYIQEMYNYGLETKMWDVISARRKGRSSGAIRQMGSYFVSWLLKIITRSNLKDIGSTFKLIKRNALDKLLMNDILIQNLPILMMNINLKVIEYPVEYRNDTIRKSHYKFSTLFYALMLALLNFSSGNKTLVTLVILGSFMTLTSILAVMYIIIQGMIHQSILPTNYLVFFLFLILTGLIFLFMGIIVFKIERMNKNLHFRKFFDQKIDSID